jgi:hypothetical protein
VKLAYTHRATPKVMVESEQNYMLVLMMVAVRKCVKQQNKLALTVKKESVDPNLDLDVK